MTSNVRFKWYTCLCHLNRNYFIMWNRFLSDIERLLIDDYWGAGHSDNLLIQLPASMGGGISAGLQYSGRGLCYWGVLMMKCDTNIMSRTMMWGDLRSIRGLLTEGIPVYSATLFSIRIAFTIQLTTGSAFTIRGNFVVSAFHSHSFRDLPRTLNSYRKPQNSAPALRS